MRDGTTSQIEMRTFGRTDMQVSALGLGGHEFSSFSEQRAGELIFRALDAGFNVIDTAECYGQSEELIGKALATRRDACYVFTKCGHSDDFGLPEWSPRLIEQSIERSLRRLHTDRLDLVLLHSCSLERLKQGEVITSLQRAQQAGKVRFIGYSGDREAARYAVSCGAFDALELSLNLADQEAIDHIIPLARAKGMGVIAKRSLANLAWKTRDHSNEAWKTRDPSRETVQIYRERLQKLRYDFLAYDNSEAVATALRFPLSVPGVHIAIVGTTNPKHIERNAAAIKDGPLPPSQFLQIHARWQALTWWRRFLPGGRLGWHGWV